MTLFVAGLFLADIENAKDWGEDHDKRPLEVIRQMDYKKRIPICMFLWTIVIVSMTSISDI